MTGRIQQRIGFGLAVLALVALVAGCGRTTEGLLTQPAAAAAGDSAAGGPVEQLTRAVKAVTGKGFTYRADTPRGRIEGAVDLTSRIGKVRSLTSVGGSDIAVDLLIFKDDYYVKVKGIQVAGADFSTFLRVQADQLESDEMFGVTLADPSNTTSLPEQFGSVSRRDDGRLAGTLDLTKGSAFGATHRDIALMGKAAKEVPFVAGIDSGGRLATLMYTLPRYAVAPGFFAPAARVSVAYADFGRPVKVAKPTVAHYVNAPPELYRQLNPA
jgi:hypothetical protein